MTRAVRFMPLLPITVAAANFCWQLGSPSLHIDEAFSWAAADAPLGDLLHRVRVNEVAPWTYYLGLHAWIGLAGSEQEWVMRLPSALAGVGTVAVTYRAGLLIGGRGAALLAATLLGASPLILTYAQQARAYIFAMLLVAVSVWAALEAGRAMGPPRRNWLALLTIASIGAFWFHYTAALVLAPLYAWLLLRGELGARQARLAAGGWILGTLALLPLLLDQLSRGHEEGVAPSARLTAENALRVAATPFDGRSERVGFWLVLGAIALAIAVLLVVVRDRDRMRRVGPLLVPLAFTPALTLTVVTIISDDVLISRYTAVAAAPLALLIARGAALAPRVLGVAVAMVALTAAVGGSVALHRPEGFNPDVDGAFAAVADGYRGGDLIVLRGYPVGPIVSYYARRDLPPGAVLAAPEVFPEHEEIVRQAVQQRRRVWTIDQERVRPALRRGSVPPTYRRAGPRRRFPGVHDLELTLAVPR